jgi:type IV secretion system protein VirB4
MLKLADYRKTTEGLPDLLPYAALVAPGVVLNKNGSLLCAWRVRGRDTASSTFSELAWIAGQANEAMKQLGNGWMLHMDAIREYSRAYPEPTPFLDAISQMIDDERRAYFGADWCYSTDAVLCLTYKPDLAAAKLAAQTRNRESDLIKETTDYFTAALSQMEDTLGAVLKMERLGERQIVRDDETYQVSDLLTHLQQCVTGVSQPVRVPPVPMYLDAILGQEDLMLDGPTPVLGNRYIAAVAIGGFPVESWPAMLLRLDGLSLPYRFSVRFLFLDQWDAIKEINRYRKGWQQGMTRIIDQLTSKKNPRINRDAALMHEDAEQAEQEVRSGGAGAGFLTVAIILMDEDERMLLEQAREVRRLLQAVGFTARIESINTMEAWLGSHPGNGYANVRRPLEYDEPVRSFAAVFDLDWFSL